MARNEPHRRGTQLTHAVHLFKAHTGRWPSSLDELPAEHGTTMRTDPFTDAEFRDPLTESGPRIYSLSNNGVDDGSIHARRWGDDARNNANGSDDFVFWPPPE